MDHWTGIGSDEELSSLLQNLHDGDALASEVIIERSCARLRWMARRQLNQFRRLRRWEQTDDVLQSAVIRLQRALLEVKPLTTRHFYLLAAKLIHRQLLDLIRHYYGPEGLGTRYRSDPDLVLRTAKEFGLNKPQWPFEWRDFHEAVASLPSTEREIVQLLWYEGLSQEAAAELLHVNLRTVKRRWRNAKLLLANSLSEASEERHARCGCS